MATNYLGINYPFQDSPKGFFLDLTVTDSQQIKSDLMHLILTRKGTRYYNPEFGTNLLKFIFEPNDGLTQSQISDEIQSVVKKYLPKLQINNVIITPSETNEHLVTVKIDYTITDDVFEQTDFVIINI